MPERRGKRFEWRLGSPRRGCKKYANRGFEPLKGVGFRPSIDDPNIGAALSRSGLNHPE
jgi:hypothetical protein